MTPPKRSPSSRRRSPTASKETRLPRDAKAELREALAQQAATSEILRVISRSQTNVQPVFEAIARKAFDLCRATHGAVYTFDGELVHLAAGHSITLEAAESLRQAYPMPPSRGGASPRAILTRAIVYIPDIRADPEYRLHTLAQTIDYRSVLAVPLLHEGKPIGTVTVTGAEAGAFSEKQIELLKTFADQAVIAIENVRLFTELQEKNQALTAAHAQVTEALDQQTATSEILRVISSSLTDVQPVFEAIVENAARLFRAWTTHVFGFDSQFLHLGAVRGPIHHSRSLAPIRPSPDLTVGRCALARSVIHIADVEVDPDASQRSRQIARLQGWRSALAAPMMRDGQLSGVIMVTRASAGAFDTNEIELLKTFADQAVIAVENVRLLTELQEKNRALTEAHAQVTEALDQQTATSEILRVISSSPTDVQPVFDIIAARAVVLCDADLSAVSRCDGELIRLTAIHGVDPEGIEAARRAFPMTVDSETVTARAVRHRAVAEIPDIPADPAYVNKDIARVMRYQSALGVPMIREGQVIGVIFVARTDTGRFPTKQIELLKTFADQAVIAIENVRLFTELEEKNQALTQAHAQATEALDQQTATSEILRVISSSPTETQPVFDVIAWHAVRLCDGAFGAVFQFDGELIHMVAHHGQSLEGTRVLESEYPRAPDSRRTSSRAILGRTVVHVPDLREDPGYSRERLELTGWRAMLAVPLMREGQAVGSINVARREVGPFSARQVALVQMFADQAVIAIENVRLFQELERRTRELGRSVEELQALGEVSRAVSSTLDLETVLNTIVAQAAQLASATGGLIYEYDETKEEFNRISGAHHLDEELGAVLRAAPMRLGEGAAGKAAALRGPVQIPDTLAEGAYDVVRIRAVLERRGYRSTLAVPLLFEQRIIGVLVVWRHESGQYAPEVVQLLQTFASQSVLAIRNAQLYRELEEKGRQLEAASRHKSEFLANMSHELRTPLNAILGFNEMLLGHIYGDVPAGMMEPLTDIQNSGKHLLRLINNVLDLSKIEAGRMELSLADYSVHDIVERVRASLHPLAAEKGLEFAASVSPDIPLAYGDGGRITQCLMNLAGNALKFTRQGRVALSVDIQSDLLVYHVADTGIGIARDKIESLFTEFRQGDASITSEFGGTGLGLSITRKFVEMHGGRVWVESELGKGSTFSFSVPLRLARGKAA